MPGTPSDHLHTLDPALLIAAAINASGELELPASTGDQTDVVRYLPDEEGRIVERRAGSCRPADMRRLAAGLAARFGALTPDAFRLTDLDATHGPRFVAAGRDADETRVRLLHRAFNIYLMAFEERLV